MRFTEPHPILYPYITGTTLCYEVDSGSSIKEVTKWLPETGLVVYGVDYDEDTVEYYVTVDRVMGEKLWST